MNCGQPLFTFLQENAAMVFNCSCTEDKITGGDAATSNVAGAEPSKFVNLLNQSFNLIPPVNYHSPAGNGGGGGGCLSSALPPPTFTPSHHSINHTTLNFTPSNQQHLFTTPSSRHKHQNHQQFTPRNQSIVYDGSGNKNAGFNGQHYHGSYYQSPYQQAPYQQSPYQQSPYHQSPYHQSPYHLRSPRRSPIVGTVKTPVNARLRSMLGDQNTPKQLHPSQGALFA